MAALTTGMGTKTGNIDTHAGDANAESRDVMKEARDVMEEVRDVMKEARDVNGCIKIANSDGKWVVLPKNRAKKRFGGLTGLLGGLER